MEPVASRRYENILMLKQGQNTKPIAFHSDRLELAEISEDLWDGLNSEALEELKSWNSTLETKHPDTSKHNYVVNSLSLNVTQICNLQCQYCAAGGDGTYGDPVKKISIDKTIPQLTSIISKLEKGQKFSLNFLGGEPLLYPQGIELISEFLTEICEQKGIELTLSITTNGTLLTEANLIILAKFKIHVTISLDGPQSVNDRFRPSKDGQSTTEKILQGLLRYQSMQTKPASLTLHAVFGKDHLDVISTYRFFNKIGCDYMEFSFDHDELNPEVSRTYMQQMAEVFKTAFAENGMAGLRKISWLNKVFHNLDHQLKVKHFCGAGQNYLMIDSKNQVFTCPWDINEPQSRVGDGSYLSSESLKKYEGYLIEKNNCQSCWARNLCGGGCMYIHKKSTGSKNKVSEVFCERTRFLISQALLYYVLSSNERGQNEAH